MSANPPSQWKLQFAAGYLVPPCIGLDESEVTTSVVGSPINLTALPRDFFRPLFTNEASRAPNHVVFVPEEGKQKNTVRDLVRRLAFGSDQERSHAAQALALRLAKVTSHRSPDGLFFTLVGALGSQSRVVIWKFPADQSIQARLISTRLVIKIVDDAFSRKSTYFKAAMFEGPNTSTSFWGGRVEDRQAGTRIREIADFWVYGFLACRPALTDVHGTRLLANALRETIKQSEDEEIQDALISLIAVLKAQPGRQLTLAGFAEEFLPESSRDGFLLLTGTDEVWQTPFNLDVDTLGQLIRIRSLTLDNKFVVRGPIDEFDDAVSVESRPAENKVRVSLEGRITSQAVLKR